MQRRRLATWLPAACCGCGRERTIPSMTVMPMPGRSPKPRRSPATSCRRSAGRDRETRNRPRGRPRSGRNRARAVARYCRSQSRTPFRPAPRRATDSSAIIRKIPSGCTPEPAGASVPRITRSSCLSSLAVRSVNSAARSLPLCTSSRPRLHCSHRHSDLIVRQRGMAAVDVADDVGVRLQHHVLVDKAGAGNRRTAGMDRAVDAVFARPGDHLARGWRHPSRRRDRLRRDSGCRRRRVRRNPFLPFPARCTGAPACTFTPVDAKIAKSSAAR